MIEKVRRSVSWARDAQERIERTLFGQGVISGIVILVVLIGVVSVMPNSPIRAKAQPALRPVAVGTGLDQNWGVFAPNPPRQLEYLTVEVTKRSGATSVWQLPHWDPVVSTTWMYRWHKIKENMVRTPAIRGPFARWYARDVSTPADPAVSVRMVLRVVPLPPPPGAESLNIRPRTTVLYEEKLTTTS